MTRSESREAAFVLAFEQFFLSDESAEDIIAGASECGTLRMSQYALNVFRQVCERAPALDEQIARHLKGWTLERISPVCRSILRVALAEIAADFCPVGVAINEAVELAKKYGTDDDYAFVNGLLGAVAKELGTPEEALQAEALPEAAEDEELPVQPQEQ